MYQLGQEDFPLGMGCLGQNHSPSDFRCWKVDLLLKPISIKSYRFFQLVRSLLWNIAAKANHNLKRRIFMKALKYKAPIEAFQSYKKNRKESRCDRLEPMSKRHQTKLVCEKDHTFTADHFPFPWDWILLHENLICNIQVQGTTNKNSWAQDNKCSLMPAKSNLFQGCVDLPKRNNLSP